LKNNMLANLLGIRLILWTGKAIPTPASYSVMRALSHVKVINEGDGNDGFQMTFTLAKDAVVDYGLLLGGGLDPDTRVSLALLVGASLEPLINGVIYHHQVAPSNEPGMSRLTVTGRDVSVLLDLKEKNEQYKNQPDFVIVNRVLANYATDGVLPPYLVTPTADVPLELFRTPRQHETDLAFLRRLAKANGYVFYLEPLTLGVTSAYWGPENRATAPQPALSVNLGTATNVTGLQFSHDALAPVGSKGSFIEPITKTSLPIPPLPSLKVPPLALKPTSPRRTTLQRGSARLNPAQAGTSVLAASMNAPDSVTGTGELDTVRYGGVLRARRLVGVRGAGFNHDGFYYVVKVVHEIDVLQNKATQTFTIKREGTGALLPVVRP
jgi:hypothetical protein